MSTLKVELLPSILEPGAALDRETPAEPATPWTTLSQGALLLLVAILAINVNGYHPYSEDAGIYVAGIKLAAHPGLYGSSAAFVTASSHMSRFSSLNALLARFLSLPLDDQLFALQVLTTWLLLCACRRIAQRCFASAEARWASVTLVAACLSIPVAGSSLFLMDPYVTGRSFSTPLTLFGIAACLEGRFGRATLLLVLVALFHPLMSIYAAGFLVLLWAIRQEAWIGTGLLTVSALAAGAAMQFSQRSVLESPAYRAAVATRPYFFLKYWQWYEVFGLLAPMALFGLYWAWRRRASEDSGERVGGDGGVALARTCLATGLAAIAVSVVFARPEGRSHFIAAMQPMRAFVLVYFCMFLLLGGVLGEFWLKRIVWRWALLFGCVAAGMGYVQHQAYPNSAYVELPGSGSGNGWKQAFLWVRANTPRDAFFALDSDYIHAPGEDAEGFRALAERGSLADFSKDGGAAAVFPQLAERWMTEHLAQTGLNTVGDAERLRRLVPLHVSWMILDRQAATAMPCPFQDDLVKVCQLR